jgi:hypothetical protein
MRYSIYATILLAVLIFNIFRFQIPYIQYVVFGKYIAEELCVKRDVPDNCCKGKCFKEKQIAAINATHESENTKEKQTEKKTEINEVKEYLPTHSILPAIAEKSIKRYLSYSVSLNSRTIAAIFIPPQN